MQIANEDAILGHFDDSEGDGQRDNERQSLRDRHDEDGKAESEDVDDADGVEKSPRKFLDNLVHDEDDDEEDHDEDGHDESDNAQDHGEAVEGKINIFNLMPKC